MAFKHLSSEERHYIEIELKNGISQNKIAEKLGRPQSSLSRGDKMGGTKRDETKEETKRDTHFS